MLGNQYLYLAVLSINIVCCVCYVNYELFQGFDPPSSSTDKPANLSTQDLKITSYEVKLTTPAPKVTSTTSRSGVKATNSTSVYNDFLSIPTDGHDHGNSKPKIKVKQFNMHCPENERPLSIGTYEIPTQRDLVLFTQRTLLKMFNSYHEKTLFLLKDIKEATRSTVALEKKCHGSSKILFKKCVKQVSRKFITIAKDLVQSLEHKEAEVIALTKDKICNMTSMRTNPILLIRILAMDEASLEFALPAFLRLLGGCTSNCHESPLLDNRPRLRQLTDQDLVIRHLLTSKNYMQLIKDTHTYGMDKRMRW